MNATADHEGSLYHQYAGNPAANYERYFTPSIGTHYARPVVDAARLGRGDRVLDVACGTGIAARLAADAVGPTGSVAGIDVNPAMLEVAAASEGAPGIEWRQGPAEQLPWDGASFDAVLCSQGLQFFTDRGAALAEMRRVLGANGRIAVATPGPTPPLFESLGEVLAAHAGPEAAGFIDAVFALHERDELRDLLDGAGFTAIETELRKVSLRLPTPAHFLWQYVTSSPLAAVASRLDEAARIAIEREVVESAQPFTDGDTLIVEPGMLLGTAHAA